jgi:F-type H+-transporting ATPase subunit epsilon
VAERLQLEIVTPQRKLVEAEVDEVRVPGVLGELGVLPGHTPLLTSLGIGELTHRTGTTTQVLAVQGGFAEVLPDRVTVLAEKAETEDEIDVEAATRERAEAQEAMKSADADELEQLASALRMAETRLAVAGRR